MVDYNKSAVTFYERNGFELYKRIKNHYEIFEKPYNALVYCKMIKQDEGVVDPETLSPAEKLEEQNDQQENHGILAWISSWFK